jgi:hypothetical protein
MTVSKRLFYPNMTNSTKLVKSIKGGINPASAPDLPSINTDSSFILVV